MKNFRGSGISTGYSTDEKMKYNKILIVLSSLALNCTSGFSSTPESAPIDMIDSRSLIEVAKSFTQAGSSSFRSSISELLDELTTTSSIIREGTDSDERPVFVNAQADFERAIVYLLKSKRIVSCTCVIHTPAPATPLCTNGEISAGLIDPGILNDQERLLTVKKRPDIIRDYLRVGGNLFTAYPKKGRELRSAEQLAILDNLTRSYPHHLHAIELDCDAIPQDLIGATYLITFEDSSTYVLSLRSYQANSPTDDKWAIWFGSIDDAAVAERLQAVTSFLRDHGFSWPANDNALTLQSYELGVQEYIDGTAAVVSGSFKDWIDTVVASLPPNAEIMEIGSGFGRDANYIESFGFKVERTDATEAFVTFLQGQGHSARTFNILTDTFSSQYDLIFANAVFLHFTPQELEIVLQKTHDALRDGGMLAFSVKKGEGEEWTNAKLERPRYFCYWDQANLVSFLQKANFEVINISENERFLQVMAKPKKASP